MKGRKEVKTDCFILKKFLYFDRLNWEEEKILLLKLYDIIYHCYNIKMKRLELLSEKIKQHPPYVDSSFDYLNLASLLTH